MPASTNGILIVTPVFNDWDSLEQLLRDLRTTFREAHLTADVLAINDNPLEPCPSVRLHSAIPESVKKFQVIHLVRNLGHQRAIAIGLAYVYANCSYGEIIVMDSDGEDRAKDIPNIVAAQNQHPHEVIFAHRSKRRESLWFRILYRFYKVLFRLLTGKTILFGNFSSIPSPLMSQIVHLPEIWNHYAAGIMHSTCKWHTVPTERGHRFQGRSQMSMMGLVIHGLSAISVYVDVLTVRLMLGCMMVIVAGVVSFPILAYIKYFTNLAIPGWATNVFFGLSIVVFQAIVFLAILTFVILNYRSIKLFIPAKDYVDYVAGVETIKGDE